MMPKRPRSLMYVMFHRRYCSRCDGYKPSGKGSRVIKGRFVCAECARGQPIKAPA